LRDRALDVFRPEDPSRRFYALRDVNLEIKSGESVALVGHNGAGKSTLLSLVAGLCPPDEGTLEVRVRVAPLLELGAGFHYDLTGRENVRLNAALLGMTRRDLDRLCSGIIEFSEIGEFINEPVRTYSSGMVMRLAFSVAFHLEAEVLIIDEVIAVGDRDFQQKCFTRLSDLRKSGRTLLFVSHSPAAVRQFCSRAIWLDHGRVRMDGPVEDVLAEYEAKKAK
jgi:ABC-type polysaccharide/polyol phosphate transport system ATPase subunit